MTVRNPFVLVFALILSTVGTGCLMPCPCAGPGAMYAPGPAYTGVYYGGHQSRGHHGGGGRRR